MNPCTTEGLRQSTLSLIKPLARSDQLRVTEFAIKEYVDREIVSSLILVEASNE